MRMRPMVLAAVLFVAGCATDTQPRAAEETASAESTPSATAADVVREELASTDPKNAPGETLYLTRVTFAPRAKIPTHTHPGTQIAFIEKGTLTFTVVRGGSVRIHEDGETRELGAGETAELDAGSWIVEKEGVVHYGRNRTDEESVILTSALLESGEPFSTEAR